MSRLRVSLVLLSALAGRAAQAHFLWAVVSPRDASVRLEFGEAPANGIIPKIAGKAAAVKGTVPLVAEGDGLVGEIPEDGPSVAGGSLDYGVIDRDGAVFMLRYYAKAAAAPAASRVSLGMPLEIAATTESGRLRVAVTQDGKPAPGADVVATLPGTAEPFAGKTDAQGNLTLPKIVGLGTIAIRAGIAAPENGTFEGKPYAQARAWATLTLGTAGDAAPKADPAAYAVLERATNARTGLPADFGGIAGTLVVKSGGKTLRAPFDYAGGHAVAIESDGWPRAETIAAAAQVSAFFERGPGGAFARGDGRNPMTFENDRIVLHDRFDTSYVVRDDEIVEVARTNGEARTVTKTLESRRAPDGKLFPIRTEERVYGAKGVLLKTVAYVDDYAQVEGAWLPKSRRIATTENGKTVVREIRFEGLKWTKRESGPPAG